MALRTASTAIARVERLEPREYSVSPTPTMQYLSFRWLITWLSPSRRAEYTREPPVATRRGVSKGGVSPPFDQALGRPTAARLRQDSRARRAGTPRGSCRSR